MLIDFIREHMEAIYGIMTFIIAVLGIVMRSKFVPREEHEKLATKFGILVEAHSKLDVRVVRIEDRINELPKAKDIQDLRLDLVEFKGSLGINGARFEHLGEQIERLQLQVDRMEDFLDKGRA